MYFNVDIDTPMTPSEYTDFQDWFDKTIGTEYHSENWISPEGDRLYAVTVFEVTYTELDKIREYESMYIEPKN